MPYEQLVHLLIPIGYLAAAICFAGWAATRCVAKRRARTWVKGMPGDRRLAPETLRTISRVCFVLGILAFAQAFTTCALVVQHDANVRHESAMKIRP